MRFRLGASARDGQSLIELIIGIAIATVIVGSVVGAIVLSVRINKQSITTKVASSLGQETLDDLRSFSEGSWQGVYNLDTKGASTTYYIFNEDTVIAQDTISSAGTFSSLALDSLDYPVIAYYSAIDNMKVLRCNDKKCEGDDESIETVDSGGLYNSLQLDVLEYPVIAHSFDPSNPTDEFRIVHCNDANCDSSVNGSESSEVVDTRARGFSLQLNSSGNPVVSYQISNGKNLYLLRCNDPNCLTSTITGVDTQGATGDYTSMQLSPSTGFPVIAYSNNGDLGVIRCDDVNCAGESENDVDTAVSSAEFISLQLDANEYPVISYYDAAPRYDLKILRCNDVNCFGDDESIVTVDATGDAGESTSIQIDSFGNPVVSYIANDKLKILHCNDIYCLGGDESIIVVDDANPDANISGTSLRLDSLGNPVVSYYDDVNDDLKVLHCDDPNCDSNVFTALAIASGTESIVIGGTTYTRWFSVENVNRDSNGNIVETGGTEDSSTQKITSYVQWDFSGDTTSISLTEFYTRSTRNAVTVFTDWSGVSGAEGIITDPTNNFSTFSVGIDFSVPGEIFLTNAEATTLAWYDSAWTKRMKISVDSSKVPSILTNFPMLVNRTEALWAGEQADGGAFLFTSGNGTTKIDHEIERYVSSSGELVAWVEIPTLASSTGTDVYIYYGNSSGGLDEQNITGTWSNGFVSVWHLNESCSDNDSGCIKDSLGNNNATAKNFSSGGGTTNYSNGKIGGADDFDGVDSYLEFPLHASRAVGTNFSVTMWVYGDGLPWSGTRTMFTSRYSTSLSFRMADSGLTGIAYHADSGDWPTYECHESGGSPSGSSWEYYGHTVGGTNWDVYRDGVEIVPTQCLQVGSPTDSGQISGFIGIYKTSQFLAWEGKLDEVRFHSVKRTADWITTDFNNQDSPSTFYTVGGEVNNP